MNEKLADNLKAEYLALQTQYEGFDTKIITIKSWATLLFSAGVIVGFKDESLSAFIVTIFAAFCIWSLETMWKGFQYCYTDRIKDIEQWFKNPQSEDIAPFQIFTQWGVVWDRHFRKPHALFKIFRQPFVCIPYVPIILICTIGVITGIRD